MSSRGTTLVTGGHGFLGTHVVDALRQTGEEPVVLDLGQGEGPAETDVVCDLSRAVPDLSRHALASVYHLAGRAHVVPKTAQEAESFFAVNVVGTENLLRALDAREIDAFVLVSTVAVYGIERGEALDENTPREAVDPYGESKRRQEDLVTEWCDRRGVTPTIVRLPLVVGPMAPGNFGAMVRALRRGRYLGIGDGTARRSMVHAADVATGLREAAGHGGVFHLTDGVHPSFRELEAALCRALQRRDPVRLPMPAARILAAVGDGLQALSRRSMPFSSRTLNKMTSALTFDDGAARAVWGWNPRSVLASVKDLV